MAGTRGIAQFRGEQLRDRLLRDNHFDAANPIHENKVNIQWHQHREILQDTKIDVFVQKDAVSVPSGANRIDITASILNTNIAADPHTEGLVLEVPVTLRKHGAPEFQFIDADGDRVYGKINPDETGNFYLNFYSEQDGAEAPYTFAANEVLDFKYATRTNLAVLPTDALLQAGSGFVEGATDARAYMNLKQLMIDLYGASGTLDNDGNPNLAKSMREQLADEKAARAAAEQALQAVDAALQNALAYEVSDRQAADTVLQDVLLQEINDRQAADAALRNELAAAAAGKGAALVGVVTDPNYSGANVQAVLANLAARLVYQEQNGGSEVTATHSREADSANGYFRAKTVETLEARILDLERVTDAELKQLSDRAGRLETEDDRAVFLPAGGETSFQLPDGKKAKPNSLFVALNSGLQAPGVNYEELLDADGYAVGINFAPDVLKSTDVLMFWWKNA